MAIWKKSTDVSNDSIHQLVKRVKKKGNKKIKRANENSNRSILDVLESGALFRQLNPLLSWRIFPSPPQIVLPYCLSPFGWLNDINALRTRCASWKNKISESLVSFSPFFFNGALLRESDRKEHIVLDRSSHNRSIDSSIWFLIKWKHFFSVLLSSSFLRFVPINRRSQSIGWCAKTGRAPARLRPDAAWTGWSGCLWRIQHRTIG